MVNSTFIILNALRVLSITSLLLAIATCIIVNVKGFPNLGQSNTIFQFMNRSVIALEALVLIFAELGWPARLFRWFPMLDDTHSWSFFGFLQIVMGSLILGYDSGISSVHFLGHSLYIFIVVPGWFIFIIGIIYMITGSFGGPGLKATRRLGSTKSPPPYGV
ncbi:7851_t:CDS:2 [Ambispora gerdemannii]|uniref:7851_t:CDS:1 n=1 Tax=Ambispora gerdemannii TaxID=144530 RepID=A0A9N9C3C5_9GLOM|nr:7851_t:CDS:2 [Ambispora gerdemannii]